MYYSSTYNSTEVYFHFLHKGAAASAATKCKQQYIYWTGTKQFTEKEKCYYFCYLLSFKKREETLFYSLPSSCKKKKNLCIAYCAIVLQLYAYYSLAPTISLKTFSILLCILVILPYSILSWLGKCHNEIINTCGGKYCMSSSLSSSLLSNSIWQNCTMWWEFDYF